MPLKIDPDMLLEGCGDESLDSGMRIDTVLDPLSGPGGPVKPAIYSGGVYQWDSRWQQVEDEQPTPVIVIDNVPSQANHLEEALHQQRAATGVPEFVLDLSRIDHLPSHLPRRISSLQFPHRNADAYLRDARLDGADFLKTDRGKAIFNATAQTCGPLMAWFPQALLYGFWQSHLGSKKTQAKHARAWVSEIIGWAPATKKENPTRLHGLKGDPLNLSIDSKVDFNEKDQADWNLSEGVKGGGRTSGKKTNALSNIGHGQALTDSTPAAVSFGRITQRATVSFAQLRRVRLGNDDPGADAAVRAVLVALGLHAHNLAFGRGFALRSGAELEPRGRTVHWLGTGQDDQACDFGDHRDTADLLKQTLAVARDRNVPLDGWGQSVTLVPKPNLAQAIRETWPTLNPDAGP
ncbi:MAG: type I-U CRISPR-associated protein Cas7 [Rhodobacteraceae bacterium]|nr:type I-U CRISPR-associated protein Cas7 [Paracoccaceae bacterium]